MVIFNKKVLTPTERTLLEILDNAVLCASNEELSKIQDLDMQTQLSGMSFCDTFAESHYLKILNTNDLSEHKNHKTRD